MTEQPPQRQRHNSFGFAVGSYTPPLRTTPVAPARPTVVQTARAAGAPVACAPLLLWGFVCWVAAFLLGRIAHHEAVVYLHNGQVGDDGSGESVVAYLLFLAGAVLLAAGVYVLGRHVDALARAQHDARVPEPAPPAS